MSPTILDRFSLITLASIRTACLPSRMRQVWRPRRNAREWEHLPRGFTSSAQLVLSHFWRIREPSVLYFLKPHSAILFSSERKCHINQWHIYFRFLCYRLICAIPHCCHICKVICRRIHDLSFIILGSTTLHEFWPAQQLASIYLYPVHTFPISNYPST
jgi:hypothetical protein